MFAGHRHAASAGPGRRLAALREEMDQLQDALWHRQSGWERMASGARNVLSGRTGHGLRRHLYRAAGTRLGPAAPVALAALAVGVGVGCVLYAVTSSGTGNRPAASSSRGQARRPSSRIVE